MPGSRTIPTIIGTANFKLVINNNELPNTTNLLAVQVWHAINKIPTASLTLLDASASGEIFALSNGEDFLPGNTIEIRAGDVEEQQTIFSGIIIKHSLRLRNSMAPELLVQCRHILYKSTLTRKNKVYLNATDSDNITSLVTAYAGRIAVDGDSITVTHREMVQFNCTDWDFLLSRAQASGLVIMVQPDAIEIKKPLNSGTADYTLTYGSSLIELEAEMDGRIQYSAVTANGWDASQQQLASEDGSDTITESGDFSVMDISDAMAAEALVLNSGAALPAPELKAWADAQQQKNKLSKIRGRAYIDGMTDFKLGGLVTINGASNRFGGNAWISAIGQQYDMSNGWKTHLQFGDDPACWLEQNQTAGAPAAAALLPAVEGLQIGLVQALEGDPGGESRVQVKIPIMGADAEPFWARIAQADAGSNRGLFFRPEIGDEVVLGFLNSDPRHAVILGGLHSSANTPPLTPADANNQKGLTSRSGITWIIDDDKKELLITTPGGNKITISDDAQGITLEDMSSNKIEMTPQGIKIQTTAKLELAAGQLVIGGTSVAISADGSGEFKANGSMSVQASGTVEIKGAMVNIN
ncbi:hypothetical protein BH10BAC3_BH10BAC3_08500 [soil metagenome]